MNKQGNISNNYTSSNLELQEQALIDKALINAGLPENQINSLIAMAKDKLSCDSNCQQKRLADSYKDKWELAKKQYTQAPEDIRQAEKNYYIYDKGYPAYKDMLYDRYTKSAEEFKKTSSVKHNQTKEEVQDMIDNYDTSTTYLGRMNEMLRIKLKKNEDIKKEIDDYINKTQTSGRKVVYEDRERYWLSTFRKIMLFIYFGILIMYIIFGRFIPKEEYLYWKSWLIIIVYILFPFYILDRLVKFIINLYSYIKSLSIHKNVYKNI
jgi:hypothetical protein